MKCEQLTVWHLSLLLLVVSSSWNSADAVGMDKARSRQYLPSAVRGTYALTCTSRWHQLKLETGIRGEFDIPNALCRAPVSNTNPDSSDLTWNVPEDVASAFARELAGSIELIPDDISVWTKWLGGSPREQNLTAKASLSCTLGKRDASGGRRVAEVGVTGTVVIATSGRMANRYGPNWWNEKWQAQVTGCVLVDLQSRRMTSGSFLIKGKLRGSYHGSLPQKDNKTIEKYFGDLLVRVESLAINPQQNSDIKSLVIELGHELFARRKAALAKARILDGQTLRGLIAELRKSTDPELWHSADLLEKAGTSTDSQPGDVIIWSHKELKAVPNSRDALSLPLW